jgi:hypothetical protein
MLSGNKLCSAALAVIVFACGSQCARADEGGVSFWLPGQFGSLAAAPGQPGWSAATVYYHATVDASAGKNFRIGGGIQAGLAGRADLVFLNLNYIFATPVLGAQAAFGMTGAYGRMRAGINATLTGPFGNSISGSRTDVLDGFANLYPLASMKWNFGVHNVMLYTMWGLPVGAYDSSRLANIGNGHWSMDYGAGYTYFNPQTGHELSGVLGFTYNFKNPYTDYKNGVDAHFDWALSQFLSKQVHVGIVGYFYNQLTATAERARPSATTSRVSPASARKSDTFSRPATCRVISTSRDITSTTPTTARAAGMSG